MGSMREIQSSNAHPSKHHFFDYLLIICVGAKGAHDLGLHCAVVPFLFLQFFDIVQPKHVCGCLRDLNFKNVVL